jgi:acyl-CoA dehydrogenase
MRDTGVICKREWRGKEVIGIRLNWSKRYITLGPVATVLGLAFKMYDPDGLLGETEEIGITCALVPTDLPGVEIGRRHIPSGQMFQNGPTRGNDVFVPLDNIIGGPEYAGKGWMMLMSALAAGRGISLPSLSCAATALSAHTTGAYSRIREQFGIPIGKFEGVQRRLGRLAASAYSLDAARRLTCAGLDEGRKLAVISGIMKSNATYRMRESVDDAMDVHAGKAVISGPRNYLGNLHQSVPIGITVEGANILTRNMIIFGQGAIRCHPHLLDEMLALENENYHDALAAFDRHFWKHVGHTARTFFRAWFHSWTGGHGAAAPQAGRARRYYKQVARYSSAFALTADVALLTLGGLLKRREMLSARLGDVLSELYFLSATLKRWEDEGRNNSDLPLIEYIAADSIAKIRRSLDEVLINLPSRTAAAIVRIVTLPGGSSPGPDDELTRKCAQMLLAPSPTRSRITSGIEAGAASPGMADLNDAFRLVIAAEPAVRKLQDGGKSLDEARTAGILNDEEAAAIEKADHAVQKAIAVDDFAPEQITGRIRPVKKVRAGKAQTVAAQ